MYTGSKTTTDLAVWSDKNFYREKTVVGKCKLDAKIYLTITGEKEKGEKNEKNGSPEKIMVI